MHRTGRLGHGGIMVNYQCTAACRHCLYACSPTRNKGGYLSREMAHQLCRQLRESGCHSVHIGGGEPFLRFEKLLFLVTLLRQEGITLEYIETNAYWATDSQIIDERLRQLRQAGADALCISLDPFHAEYVPQERPIRLARQCDEVGMGFFLWRQEYLPVLSELDLSKKHSRGELEQALSPHYIWETAQSYGLNFGGRAVNIESEYLRRPPLEQIVTRRPCRELLNPHHYHVDLYGQFIPPCTGIILPLEEAVQGVPEGKYPVLEALLEDGIAGLLDYASGKGFSPAEAGYPSKCNLCFHIRHWLAEHAPTPELDREHYVESLEYY